MESIPREHLVQVQVADNQFDFVRVFKKQIVWCSSQTLDVGAKVFIEVGKLILCGVMCDSRDYIVDDGDDDNGGGNGNDGGDGGDGHGDEERGNAGDHQATPPDTADEDGTEDNSGEEEDDEDIDADSRTPPLKRARDDTTPPMSSSSSSSSSDDDGMKMDDGERCSKGGSTSPPSVRQWQPIEKLTTLVHEDGTIVIGDNGTRVPVSVLQQANWDNYRKCVRSIMRSLFSREYIANHTLSGKPAPVNIRKTEHVPKAALDPAIMADIIQCVLRISTVDESDLRASITGFCADELKGLRKREKRALMKM